MVDAAAVANRVNAYKVTDSMVAVPGFSSAVTMSQNVQQIEIDGREMVVNCDRYSSNVAP